MTTVTDYLLTTTGILIVWAALFNAIGGETLKVFEIVSQMMAKLV